MFACAPDVKGNNVVIFPRTGSAAARCFGSTTLCFCAHTNVDGDDPDITGDIVRFNTLTKWHGHHKWQVTLHTSTRRLLLTLCDGQQLLIDVS